MENHDRKEAVQIEDSQKQDGMPARDESLTIATDSKQKELQRPILWDFLKAIFQTLFPLLLAICIVVFVVQFTKVQGSSMFPTLQEGDRLLMEKISIHFDSIKVGDIVVVEARETLQRNHYRPELSPLIKRVIALEGDKLQIIAGAVFVNEKKIIEPYIQGDATFVKKDIEMLVPDNHLFLMGDHRPENQSIDSRNLGTMHKNNVKGKIIWRVYPLLRFGSVHP